LGERERERGKVIELCREGQGEIISILLQNLAFLSVTGQCISMNQAFKLFINTYSICRKICSVISFFYK
jgi:hypothetical protein